MIKVCPEVIPRQNGRTQLLIGEAEYDLTTLLNAYKLDISVNLQKDILFIVVYLGPKDLPNIIRFIYRSVIMLVV